MCMICSMGPNASVMLNFWRENRVYLTHTEMNAQHRVAWRQYTPQHVNIYILWCRRLFRTQDNHLKCSLSKQQFLMPPYGAEPVIFHGLSRSSQRLCFALAQILCNVMLFFLIICALTDCAVFPLHVTRRFWQDCISLSHKTRTLRCLLLTTTATSSANDNSFRLVLTSENAKLESFPC